MILIADSGSTKTQWCLLTASGQSSEFHTDGINPFFQASDQIRTSISSQLLPQMAQLMWAGTLTHVFFYGAGCTPDKSVVVASALQSIFPKAKIDVFSDMLGAARGLLQHSKGVACILGTGSNSCYYDGEKIVSNVPALGFILGDEGSGAVLGKRLVADLLKNQLPQSLKTKFLQQYEVTQADIIEHVYRQPFPNRYLAQFSRFCAENIQDPSIHQLVYDHFVAFVERNVRQYFFSDNGSTMLDTHHMPVGFVGSIAYYYRDVLQQVLDDRGFTLSDIMITPMEGLQAYHRSDVVPTQV